MYKVKNFYCLILFLSVSFNCNSAEVKGVLISRFDCSNIDFISILKVDGEIVLEKYVTNNGQFVLNNIEKGMHNIEITCHGYSNILILDVIIDEDLVILPPFKLHPVISDRHTDLMSRSKCNRPEKIFQNNGKLIAEGKYKRKFHIKHVKGYFLTVKNGLWKYYDENGNIESKVFYKDGTPHGLIEEYNSNGKLFFKGYNCNGMNCGQWIYYGKDGSVDCIATFSEHSQVIKFIEIYNKECAPFYWAG